MNQNLLVFFFRLYLDNLINILKTMIKNGLII